MSRPLTEQYELMCKRVAVILADEDLIGIAEDNPDPIGEYAGEAAEIVRRAIVPLRTPIVVDLAFMARVVMDVFKSEFEIDIASNEAERIAGKIAVAVVPSKAEQ